MYEYLHVNWHNSTLLRPSGTPSTKWPLGGTRRAERNQWIIIKAISRLRFLSRYCIHNAWIHVQIIIDMLNLHIHTPDANAVVLCSPSRSMWKYASMWEFLGYTNFRLSNKWSAYYCSVICEISPLFLYSCSLNLYMYIYIYIYQSINLSYTRSRFLGRWIQIWLTQHVIYWMVLRLFSLSSHDYIFKCIICSCTNSRFLSWWSRMLLQSQIWNQSIDIIFAFIRVTDIYPSFYIFVKRMSDSGAGNIE